MRNFISDFETFRSIKFGLVFRTIEKALRLINAKDKICMIPCGHGWFFHYFFKKNYKFFAGDINLRLAKISYQRAAELWTNGYRPPIIECNLKNIPFKDNSFNCFIAIRTIGHFPEEFRIDCLKEMKRVTKRWILVQYASKHTIKYFFRKLRNSPKLDDKFKERLSTDHSDKPERFYRKFKARTGLKKMNKKEMYAEADKAGLKVKKIFSLMPLFSERWYVLLEKTD